jgi:2-polyprenyl-3-methyl-5-hydroxy-6-metoxy-1,4-benzoquinol methylase
MAQKHRSHASTALTLPKRLVSPANDASSAVFDLLPAAPARIIDIGAGAGRDASLLAGMGYSVLAVEPVNSLLRAGMAKHLDPRIAWLQDALPLLPKVIERNERFDAVLLFGVWGHLGLADRSAALFNLSRLLGPGGVVLMSVRTDRGDTQSSDTPLDIAEIVDMAAPHGLRCVLSADGPALRASDPAGVWRQLGFRAG